MNRKDKIKEYKRSIQPMGVYQIRNKVNGKIFLGSSKDLKGILNRIKFQLKNNLHRNSDMQNDFNEIGGINFSFEILDYLEPSDNMDGNYTIELQILEDMWMEKIKPFNEKGYNKNNRQLWHQGGPCPGGRLSADRLRFLKFAVMKFFTIDIFK